MEMLYDFLWFGMKALTGFGILLIYLLCVDWVSQIFKQKKGKHTTNDLYKES